MPLSTHFDRTVIISLPERGDRRGRLMENIRSCGLAEHRDILWHDAVNGRRERIPAWWRQGPGAWGCRASHLQVLQHAQRDGVERLLIIEDDACFHSRAAEWLDMLMPLLPADWDLFFLGGQHMAEPRRTREPRLLRGSGITRTHAYAIHQRAFARLVSAIGSLEEYRAHPGWHVDHQLAHGMGTGRWKALAPAWWLAGQEEGQSDIAVQRFGRRWWPPGTDFWKLPFIAAPEHNEISELLYHAQPPEDGLPATRMERAVLLRRTAREAWQQGRLPAAHGFSAEEIRTLWPAGLHTIATDSELARLADYPANGLFPHVFFPTTN